MAAIWTSDAGAIEPVVWTTHEAYTLVLIGATI